MGSPAGLHGGHLFRLAHVGDVEDADAAEALGADRFLNALRSAVEPAACLFHRHDQQVAVDRHVSLTARAHDGGDEPGLPRIFDVVGIEPVEAAEEEMIPLEREVGVREAKCVRPRRRLTWIRRLRIRARVPYLGLGRRRAPALRSRGLAAGRLRIEESLGLGEIRDELHVERGLAGVPEPGLESRYADRRAAPHSPARRPGLRQPASRLPYTIRTRGPSCLCRLLGERMSSLEPRNSKRGVNHRDSGANGEKLSRPFSQPRQRAPSIPRMRSISMR